MIHEYFEAPVEWLHKATFVIPGKPRPKGRPRFSPLSRTSVRTYTDKETKEYEFKVGVYARGSLRGEVTIPAGVPVRIEIVAVHPRPKRLHRKVDPEGRLVKATRGGGDLDNHTKIILDGCNAIVFDDDCQVASITADAFIAAKNEEPFSRVSVYVPSAYCDAPSTR